MIRSLVLYWMVIKGLYIINFSTTNNTNRIDNIKLSTWSWKVLGWWPRACWTSTPTSAPSTTSPGPGWWPKACWTWRARSPNPSWPATCSGKSNHLQSWDGDNVLFFFFTFLLHLNRGIGTDWHRVAFLLICSLVIQSDRVSSRKWEYVSFLSRRCFCSIGCSERDASLWIQGGVEKCHLSPSL